MTHQVVNDLLNGVQSDPKSSQLIRLARAFEGDAYLFNPNYYRRCACKAPALDDLQPGDIIYWYDNSRHNGLSIGDGKAIHAPRTGKNIEITNLGSMPYFAATRP
ncbi:NlpC/P60 family protein [Streptomyces marianii]|uniref:NlpC/P60 family protein n=1 Tax=Streptomyces marianii TaxID=1817406 RepID=UPI001F471B62|nr:NlpC/P60 family protein [Streptomyces marianii]